MGAVATYACFAADDLLGAGADAVFTALRGQVDRGAPARRGAAGAGPRRVGDTPFGQWIGRYMRMAAGVGGAAALLDRFRPLDVRAALADVAAPVLALHREGDRFIPSTNAAYIVDHVPDGRAAILPGTDSVIWAGDVDTVAAHVVDLLAELPS